MNNKFECARCGYKTNLKNNLIRHVLRKKLCKYIDLNTDINRITILLNNNIIITDDIIEKINTLNKPKKKKDITKKYHCKYCNKGFLHQQSKSKHELHRCHAGKLIRENEQNNISPILTNNENCTITNINGNHNSVTNNITNNIVLTGYNSPNIEYVTDTFLHNTVKHKPMVAVYNLVELIYCNDKHPENKNVIITSEQSKNLFAYDGSVWVKASKTQVIEDLKDNAVVLFTQYVESNFQLEDYNDVNEKLEKIDYYKDDAADNKKLNNKIMLAIMNSQDKNQLVK
jgi:hypothetical protein